jgi:predicted ribosomally synthesized peptide with nif11-like leader
MMSVENAKAFLEKLNRDETFLNQIAGAGNDEARLQMANKAGFEFSAEELTSVIDQLSSEELSDDELDAVAGGRTAFAKYDGIDGEIFKRLSKNFEEVKVT